ncbi:MAG: hypothetical protein AB1757_06015 [Acidobacteriota bacterium]
MRRRIYLAAILLIAVTSVAVATLVAVQKAKPKSTGTSSTAAQKNAAQKGATPAKGAATAQAPIRPADPNRAPQAQVDEALFTNEDFFGVNASVARPYAVALERVGTLATQYPKDARLRLYSARLAERLGQFDKATTEMNQYAELKGRSPDALRRLVQFYHNRALHTDEVKTLRSLAQAMPVSERAPIYKQAATLVRTYALKEFKPADFFAELVAADSSNVQPVKDYVEELRLAKQNREALAVLAEFQAKFSSDLAYFLKTRAAIYEEQNDRRAAEAVYADSFDPNWSRKISGDYYELLRRFGRYRVARRGLQERVKAGATDLPTTARLFSFLSYEGNYAQASQVLRDLEARRAGRNLASTTNTNQPQPVRAASWTGQELEQTAAMFASIGHFDQASRYLYTLYLLGKLQPATVSREAALFRLFKVMIDAEGTPTRVGAGDLSFYKDIAEVDRHPGFMNGVLSLILANTEPAMEFATEEKAAAGYFNRAFAYRIFNAFKLEFPQSKNLGEMYLGIVNVFATMGEHKLAIATGREFLTKFPDSSSYIEVSLKIADSYVALDDRVNERATILPLLDRLAKNRPRGTPLIPSSAKRWAYTISPGFDAMFDKIKYTLEAYSDTYEPSSDKSDSGGDEEYDEEEGSYSNASTPKPGVSYSQVLERYVSSLATDDKQKETVAFFWAEIKKHPKDEGLYERFLSWLGQAQLINEQLKAYNQAIREFNSNTWYHRLARWYVRQKRGRELQQYAKQLIGVFDEEEISDYLYRFAGYGGTAEGDSLNWDQKLAFDLYDYAHKRFPRNLFFVRGMLTYLWNNRNTAEWEKLSQQYYFADRSIREPYLAWLSKQNQLRDKYQQSRNQKSEATGQNNSTNIPKNFAYQTFAADAALWLSHHDESLDVYRQLNALYPGETQYADRLADLTRSFGQTSDKLFEESAKTFEQMAAVYPANHDYRIKAGEVYAQLGDFKRAGEQWDKLIQIEPGDRETYLEVATVYWDYYQFEQALRVFGDLRQTTGDPNIYAYRMGAVYEGKGDMDLAIAEYVKVLNEAGAGRDTVSTRLAQLARRKGLEEKIVATYNRAHSANPNDWQLVIGYASYLAERERTADALALIRREIDKSADIAFLETTRDLFRSILRPEDELQVIARLAKAARDEREAMMYRLQNAAFLERRGKVDEAIAIVDKLVAEYPTNVGVVEESAKFYWRAGLIDRSLDLYKNTLAKAQGENLRTVTLQLARRQAEASRLDDAEKTLRTFYETHRTDTEAFAKLAEVLGTANKLDALTELYKAGLKDMREVGGDEARDKIAELRAGMIQTYDKLGKYTDAIDQHIEIINQFPEDEAKLAAAFDYAEKRQQVDRLIGYYQKLSKDAFKNYRWQLVLARMYERTGNVAGASEQYKNAVANEPSRAEFRFSLASTLARQRRFDEAIAVLRDGWTISGRDPQWLVEVARLQVSQGKRTDAVATIRQALAAKKNPKAEDELAMAGKLSSWGLNAEATRFYEEIFARLPKVLKDEYVSADTSVKGYVFSLIRTDAMPTVYQKLQRMREQYKAISDNSKETDAYKARNFVNALDSALRADFGQGVLDFASAQDAVAIASAIQTATQKYQLYTDKDELLRYIGIAHGAGLVETEESLLARIKDLAFKARAKPEDTKCYAELRALMSFYNRRAQYARAAEVLKNEFANDRYKERFDYQNQIANEYALAGDKAKETDALRIAYTNASGALINAGEVDWVKRYYTLLYETGNRDELQKLASAYNPYQLQLANFFIEKNEKDLARIAIAHANQSAAWVASRSAEVGLFLKDNSSQTENFFKTALDIRPIGQMLGRKVDQNATLLGDDWFYAARNYGYWLGNNGRDVEGRKLTPAEIEGNPSDEAAQLELAAYYLDRKDTKRALSHVALAAELAPNENQVALMRGAVLLAEGNKQGAFEAWGAMMNGRVSVDDAESYLKVMADNGFLKESLPLLENFIIAYVNRPVKNSQYETRMEALEPLIREIVNRASAGTLGAVAASLDKVMSQTPNDMSIGRLIVEERLLPENQLLGIYRTIHQKFADAATATFGTPEYEDGTYVGGVFVYPARDLSEWRRMFLDHLIRAKLLDEAKLLVTTIKQEQADIDLALEEADEEATDYYEWLPLASALVELRRGQNAQAAIAELRDYCGLSSENQEADEGYESSDQATLHEHCLKAYALLVQEKRETEAESLLYDAYRKAARNRYASDASLAGLAEIEARRGQTSEVSRLLKLIVERSTDNLRALKLAAETAARLGRFADAIDFREQIAISTPDDATNKTELVRLIAAAGRNAEAVDRAIALLNERTTPNSARAQIAEVIGEIAKVDRAAGERVMRMSQQEAGAMLARAAYEESTGNLDGARTILERIKGPLEAVAQLKLGVMMRNSNRDAEAVKNLERALYLDADGLLTSAIQYRASTTRAHLIMAYSRLQRDTAAIRLTEGETSGSVLSAAARQILNAANSSDEDEQQTIEGMVFEPALAVVSGKVQGLPTLADLNQTVSVKLQSELLAALADSSARLGRLDRALALERLRVADEKQPQEKTAIEKRIETFLAALRQREQANTALLRVNTANATTAIYSARVLGN